MTRLGWDAVGRAVLRMRGTVRIAPDPHRRDVLAFDEEGELRLGSHRGGAFRRYLVRPDRDGSATMLFEDGRVFHRLDLRAGTAAVAHDCAPDRYDGRVSACGPDRWTVTWRVVGPRKRQLIASRFDRL